MKKFFVIFKQIVHIVTVSCAENIFPQHAEDCHCSRFSLYCLAVLYSRPIFSNFKFLLRSLKGTDNNLISITMLNDSDSKWKQTSGRLKTDSGIIKKYSIKNTHLPSIHQINSNFLFNSDGRVTITTRLFQ